MKKKIDLVGQRFTRLTVIERSHIRKPKKVCWRCRCDCGLEKHVEGGKLTSGQTRSCGCLKGDVLRNTVVNVIHPQGRPVLLSQQIRALLKEQGATRPDTRDLTGRWLGDPLPGRSALDQKGAA